jgi:hypothetical protein
MGGPVSPRRLSRLGACLLAATLLGGSGVLADPPIAAASDVTFGTPTASSRFGQGIDFYQPYETSLTVTRAEIRIDYPAALGPSVTQVEVVGGGRLHYRLDTSTGNLLPNTTLTARWEVVLGDGSATIGPSVKVTYADDRFNWKTVTAGLIRMHWYGLDASQGQTFADIGAAGLAKAVSYIGATESAPIDFFVYPNQQDFMQALGPGTGENVGGLANAAGRTCFALIEPSYLSYGRSVIPHELTHVVFHDATDNPYSRPPDWLNEGLATYLADGYDSSNRSLVRRAVADKSLMPLAALAGDFPSPTDRFELAYAEATSAVDFFVRKYGKPAMNDLLAAYGRGATDDEAFRGAINMPIDEFDAAWLTEQGMSSTPTYGPQPAPTGPLPPGWGSAGASAGATASPPAGSPTTSAPASPGGQQPAGSGGMPNSMLLTLLLAALLSATALVLLAVAATLYRRDRAGKP